MAGNVVLSLGNSFYVKVNMDGRGVGRKVNLNAYNSYENLVDDLENMFELTESE